MAMIWSCSLAVLLALANKYAVSGVYWNINFFLVFLQSSTAVVLMGFLRFLGIIKNAVGFDRRKALRGIHLAPVLVVMNYVRLKALQCLSLPTHTIILNLEIMFIAYAETIFTTTSLSWSMIASFIIMSTGVGGAMWSDYETAIASSGDRRLIQTLEPPDPAKDLLIGYVLMVAYLLLSAIHSLLVRKISKRTNLHDWDVIWYNNLFMLPVAGTLSYFIEDFSSSNLYDNFPPAAETRIIISIIASGILTALAPHASVHCSKVSGDIKSSFIDNFLCKMVIALSGLVWFRSKDQVVTADGVSAIGLVGLGGFMYLWARRRQKGERGHDAGGNGTSLPMRRGVAGGIEVGESSKSWGQV